MQNPWFKTWFDTNYYHILYKHRDYSEASLFIDNISQYLKLMPNNMCWDLCCGKGRHSIYLNKKGYNVIGTDLSEQSINEANKHSNEHLEFYTHDMRNLFRTNYFNTVFNLFTSFGYFDKQSDDVNVFKAVEKALKPNGYFVFDFLNENFIKSNLVLNESKTIENITFHISKKVENNTVIKHINFTDNNAEYNFEERVKLFSKSYFEELATLSNLNIIHTFGNYKLENFDINNSPRLILVLQKK